MDAELHTVWNRRLYAWWDHYNEEYVGSRLQRPLIDLNVDGEALGHWDGELRRISISTSHLRRHAWEAVMDTLRHEMAHQYASEILQADEPPHGAAFRRACEIMRCAARATAAPATAGPQEDRIVRVLKKVLSLADSPNEHEAQSAVNKARSLLLEYNLDLVELDRERNFDNRSVGPVKGRRSTWELWLAMILNEFFFVEVLWARSYEARVDREGTILQLYGTATNLEMATYVYEYMTALIQRLWLDFRTQNDIDGNRERMRYYAGVMQGFHAKLKDEAAATRPRSRGSALVWQGDHRLRDYYRYLNPHVETRSTRGVSDSEAFREGIRDGLKVTIRKPLSSADGFGGLLAE